VLVRVGGVGRVGYGVRLGRGDAGMMGKYLGGIYLLLRTVSMLRGTQTQYTAR
jgi:hypothetical protein